MPRVMLRCPLTSHLIATGYEFEAATGLRRRLPRSSSTACGECGRVHTWTREEAVIEGRERRARREIVG